MKNGRLTILTIILFILTTFLFLQFAGYLISKYSIDWKTGEILIPQFMIIGLIIFVFVEIISCFITVILAKKKNRNISAWVALNLFVNPLSFIVLFFLPSKATTELDK